MKIEGLVVRGKRGMIFKDYMKIERKNNAILPL
jgi:hypothetical protein